MISITTLLIIKDHFYAVVLKVSDLGAETCILDVSKVS